MYLFTTTNWIVERKHWHILNVDSALKLQSWVPNKYWGRVLTASYLINLTPSSGLNVIFPFKKLHGTSLKLSHLSIFFMFFGKKTLIILSTLFLLLIFTEEALRWLNYQFGRKTLLVRLLVLLHILYLMFSHMIICNLIIDTLYPVFQIRVNLTPSSKHKKIPIGYKQWRMKLQL